MLSGVSAALPHAPRERMWCLSAGLPHMAQRCICYSGFFRLTTLTDGWWCLPGPRPGCGGLTKRVRCARGLPDACPGEGAGNSCDSLSDVLLQFPIATRRDVGPAVGGHINSLPPALPVYSVLVSARRALCWKTPAEVRALVVGPVAKAHPRTASPTQRAKRLFSHRVPPEIKNPQVAGNKKSLGLFLREFRGCFYPSTSIG